MPTSVPSSTQEGVKSSPLVDALDKNKEATEAVKRAADDLAVVHAVLDTKIAQGASEGDVKRAVDETRRLEKHLGDSAEKLDEVNETLEREVLRSP